MAEVTREKDECMLLKFLCVWGADSSVREVLGMWKQAREQNCGVKVCGER